jgi:mediator of RNA polymerase II transcription subunit 31
MINSHTQISFNDDSHLVLAQRDYFKDPAFVNYLKYLLYWKKPEFAKFLKYPMCLYFLDLLQSEEFRRKIVSAPCVKFIDDQAILLWQHYTRRRTKILADKGRKQ